MDKYKVVIKDLETISFWTNASGARQLIRAFSNSYEREALIMEEVNKGLVYKNKLFVLSLDKRKVTPKIKSVVVVDNKPAAQKFFKKVRKS